MFGTSKQPDPSKIRLPKAAAAPRMPELQFIGAQAQSNVGREVEMMWSEPSVNKTYCMSAKMDIGMADPMWTLLEDDGSETKLVWRFETSDYDLINDVVSMLHKQSSTDIFSAPPPAAPEPNFANTIYPAKKPAPPPTAAAPTTFQAGFFQQQSQAPSGDYQPGYFQQTIPPQGFGSTTGPNKTLPSVTDTQGGLSTHQRPLSTGHVPPFSPAARKDAENPFVAVQPVAEVIEGSLEETPVAAVLYNLSQSRVTGKLEVMGEDSTGDVFFENGMPKHAGTPSEYGDSAIKELVTWEKGSFVFKPNVRTDMKSVEKPLATTVAEGNQLLDQKRHLKKSGLSYESVLVRRHKNVSDTELRLMLSKGAPLDFDFQRDIYSYLNHKRTFTDLLRDKPMDSSAWSTVLFNFLSCGLIEIKPPDAIKGSQLDFLGDAHAQVNAISESFTRPETGIYSFPALMFFMEYEFHRYEAYNFPMSLIVFQMHRRRPDSMGTDLLNAAACSIAAMRIDLVKRNLDVLGHFETVDFGLLLPNTGASSAAFVANRIYEALTATPLVQGLEREQLALAFGVASLPADGEDLESLVYNAKAALAQAKIGTFPIVLSRPVKRD